MTGLNAHDCVDASMTVMSVDDCVDCVDGCVDDCADDCV
jgi:hypothetical protein